MTFRAYRPRPPCAECLRCHRGPRCKPTEARTENLTVSLPSHIHRALMERVPWGDRSAWVADVLQRELET